MTNGNDDKHERAQAFFLEEYKSLRQEIASWLTEIATFERHFLIGTAATYIWLATVQFGLGVPSTEKIVPQSNSGMHLHVLSAMWFIPFVLGILGGIRVWGIGTRIGQIGSYMRVVEEGWRSKDLDVALGKREHSTELYWGWEGFLPEQATGLSIASKLFWSTSIAVTFVMAEVILFIQYGAKTCNFWAVTLIAFLLPVLVALFIFISTQKHGSKRSQPY
jgi:hypothetical protein